MKKLISPSNRLIVPKLKKISIFNCLVFVIYSHSVNADVVSATDKYAWSENASWFNFNSSHNQVDVYDDHLEGFAWAAKVGWIKLGSYAGGGTHTYINSNATDWGVNNDGAGNLSGYAWGENIGWINFNPSNSQVTINAGTGDFDGYAWSAKLGWIHFQNTTPAYKVKRVAPDTVPDAFDFTNLSNVALNTTVESASITISGINSTATISVTDGEFEINGSGVWLSSVGSINNGNTLKVRHTSANNYSSQSNTTLDIGGVLDIFSSTTTAAPSAPPPTPSPTPSPTPTPTPTPSPEVTPTPTPTPMPTNTPTPIPTPTPTPTPIITPVTTPIVTPTPEPTITPEPTLIPNFIIPTTNLFDVNGSAFSATPVHTSFTTDIDISVENIIAVVTLENSDAKIEREHGSVVEINAKTIALFHPEYTRPVGVVDTIQGVVSLIRGEINTIVSCDIPGQFRVQTELGVVIVVKDNLCESNRRENDISSAEFIANYSKTDFQASLTVSAVSGSITVVDREGNISKLSAGQDVTLNGTVKQTSWVLPVDGGFIYGGVENLLSWTSYPGAAGYLLEYNMPIPEFSDENVGAVEFLTQTIRLFPDSYEIYEDLILYRITLGDIHDGSLVEARIFPIDVDGRILSGSVSSDKTSVRWK